MSRLKTRSPVIHTPSFREYYISGANLLAKYQSAGIEKPFPTSDSWYYHTDEEGWASLIRYLALKSSLYKADKFDCEDYAMKAMLLCAELYGLNSLRYTYGKMPLGYHGFNTCWTGDRFLVFEPNEGFASKLDGNLIFEMGENEYEPMVVLL